MEEFTLRAATKIAGKKNNVFKLHKDDQVTWTEAKMRRENDYQPWQIKLGSGRAARRFKAIKEGGVGENASYFVFYRPKDSSDCYEVCPVDEWYSVSATQRYKTLTAEEAEQKFEQRHKTLNLFSVMHMKKNGEAGEEGGTSSNSKAFKVSELDDWENSGDDFDGSDEDNGDGDDENKRKNRKKKSLKKEKDETEDAPEEGKEDSDEGDFEQREVDYMSDSSSESSESGTEVKEESNVKGIAEEEALRDLLSTDDEEDADRQSPQKSNANFNSNRNSLGTVDIKQEDDSGNSDESSDSDDYDVDEDKMDSLFMKKSLPAQLVAQGGQDIIDGASNVVAGSSSNQGKQSNGPTGSSTTTSAMRRKAPDDELASSSSSQSQSASSQPPPRRPRPADNSSTSANSLEKVVEDLTRKYLRRKPLPLKVLLKDIKAKLRRQGAVNPSTEDALVNAIAVVIRRLKPDRQKIHDVVYFSLPN